MVTFLVYKLFTSILGWIMFISFVAAVENLPLEAHSLLKFNFQNQFTYYEGGSF